MPDLDTLFFNTTAVKPPTYPRNETERRAKAQQAKTEQEEAAAVAQLVQSRRVKRKYPLIDSVDATPEHPTVDEGDSSPLFVRSTSATPTRDMTPEADVATSPMDQAVPNEDTNEAIEDTTNADINTEPAQNVINEDIENTHVTDAVPIEFNDASAAPGDATTTQPSTFDYDLTLRHHYQDEKGVDREIWRPGDPDGDPNRGHFLDPSPATAIPWRLFQHSIGKIVKHKNEPPKYVLLDDLAVYEVLESGAFSKKHLNLFWNHDFGNTGNVRANRAHVGRAAIVPEDDGEVVDNEDGKGPRWIGVGRCGQAKSEKKYLFTGEKDGYDPILYPPIGTASPTIDFKTNIMADVESAPAEQPLPTQPATKKARKEGRPAAAPAGSSGGKPAARPLRAHEIYTNPNPIPRHKKPKINTYLRATPSPPWPGPFRTTRADHKRKASTAFGEENNSQAADSPQPETTTPIQNVGVADTVYEKVRGLEQELADVKWDLRERDKEIDRLNAELEVFREQGHFQMEEGEQLEEDA